MQLSTLATLISCDLVSSSSVFDGVPRNKQQITATGGAVLGEAEQLGRLLNAKETLGETEGEIKNRHTRGTVNIGYKTHDEDKQNKQHNTEN